MQPGSQSSFTLGQFQGFSYKRVRVTQGGLCISPGVALDKTPNTSKKKFCIRRLTLSILNPSSLMLTKLQKSLTSIDFFKKVMAKKDDKEGWWLLSLRTCFPIHSTSYDGEKGWQGRMMTFLPTHSSPYALDFSWWRGKIARKGNDFSPYALVSPLRLCTNRKNIPCRYLSEIVYLSRHAVCHPRLL